MAIQRPFKLFLLTFFIFGLCIPAFAQKLEFGLGYQAIYKTYKATVDLSSLEQFHAVKDEKTGTVINGLTATQGIRTAHGYVGLFENLQWQQIDIHAAAGYSYFAHSNNHFYTFYHILNYKESRTALGIGLDGAIDLLPSREHYHLFVGAQLSGETAITRNITTDEVRYEETDNDNVTYDSTYTASPFIAFTNLIPVAAVYVRQQMMFTPRFGISMMLAYRYATSPVLLNEISYSKRGFAANLCFTYTLELPGKEESK